MKKIFILLFILALGMSTLTGCKAPDDIYIPSEFDPNNEETKTEESKEPKPSKTTEAELPWI